MLVVSRTAHSGGFAFGSKHLTFVVFVLYVTRVRGVVVNKKGIITVLPLPGTKEWEEICKYCGLCCLVKYRNEFGEVFLTRVACDHLDLNTGKCKCYDPNVAERGDTATGCRAHDGETLNERTLKYDYIVPASCAYVQKFLGPIRCSKRMPNIQLSECVHESDVTGRLSDYVIPNTHVLFKYNMCRGI